MKQIYLDNSATTRISDEALDKYIKVSKECYGNPSSLHSLGFDAEKQLDSVRGEICASLGAKGATVIFTASGTEANNLAIIGRAMSKERYRRGAKIITTMGEHASVDASFRMLEDMGFKVARIPTVGGKIDIEALKSELTREVILVSIMMVNNETGAVYDTAEVAKHMKEKSPEALLHIDATQSYLKIPFTKAKCGADMITISSHKIEGPKGVGALVVDGAVMKAKGLAPLVLGGGQEGGMRSGTENVPGIAAFGEAVRIGNASLRQRYAYISSLKNYLTEKIEGDEALREISITKPPISAPHIINITLPKIKSETMLNFLSGKGFAVSSGSACAAQSGRISNALLCFGLSEAEADTTLRISLCAQNTEEELIALCDALKTGIKMLARMKR